MNSKQELRSLFVQKRATFKDALSLERLQNRAIKFLSKYNSIGLTVSFENEIDTHKIIVELLSLNKTVSVPKIEKGQMKFYKMDSIDELEKGTFNILEPISDIEIIPECILVPMLSFNSNNYRIGYGKGYFDQYLQDKTMIKIGIAYKWMLSDFHEDEHDIALDYIIIE